MENDKTARIGPDEIRRQQVFMRRIRAINERNIQSGGDRRTAAVETFGCQQNVSDSEKIKGMLDEMGYDVTEDMEHADVALYNTCAVREHAERRALGHINALKPFKSQRPSMIIGLCGCMAQEAHVAQEVRRECPHVDLVFGTGALVRFPELLYTVITKKERVFDTEPRDAIAEGLPVRRDGRVRAWLPVSYGCNNFCTYCIVPYVRGRERSRSPEAVLGEARELVAQGYRDITLLGQNVNSYGGDRPDGCNFAQLLRRVDAIPGDFRIRFMTSHPKDATPELFAAIAESPKVVHHIHLPFQAGSDRILRLMNRRYTKEQYIALTEQARAMIPGLSFTSDVIVGYPGETYAEFCETLDVIRRVEFDSLFTFIYSPREGTPAARMEDPVPHEEKTRWFAQLLEIQDEIGRRRLARFEGRTVRVLCEGPGKTGEGYMSGRTDNGTIVDFPGDASLAGQFCDVKITQLQKFMLLGERTGRP